MNDTEPTVSVGRGAVRVVDTSRELDDELDATAEVPSEAEAVGRDVVVLWPSSVVLGPSFAVVGFGRVEVRLVASCRFP